MRKKRRDIRRYRDTDKFAVKRDKHKGRAFLVKGKKTYRVTQKAFGRHSQA